MELLRAGFWNRRLSAILLFSLPFGYLEAAVVSYLRALHEPVRQHYHPGRPASELFPLLTPQQTRSAAPEQIRIIAVEVGREAATLAMLAALALAVSRNVSEWAAAFAIAFGTWDLAFYAGLKLLLDWPASLLTWDVLLLIPVPWAAPVLAPSLVSVAMIAAGVRQFQKPVPIGRLQWTGIFLGAAVVIVSFTLDYRNLLGGGVPNPFAWRIFGAGMAIGLLSYAHAVVATARSGPTLAARATA
jgi:hypothetical protein